LISKLDQKIEKSNFLVRTVKSSHDVAIGLFFDKIPFSLFLMSRFRQKSPNHDSKTEKVNFIPFSTPTTFPGFYRPKIPPKFSWGASRLAHSETRARSQGGFGPRGAREKLFFLRSLPLDCGFCIGLGEFDDYTVWSRALSVCRVHHMVRIY